MAERYNLEETAPTEKLEAPRSNRIYPVSYEGEITAEEEKRKAIASLPANLAGVALYVDDYIRQKQYYDYSNDLDTLKMQSELDLANKERDLMVSQGNIITDAQIRLESKLHDVNQRADSDISFDRISGVKEVYDEERTLAEEQSPYTREKILESINRREPMSVAKARESQINDQISLAKQNVEYRGNQLLTGVLKGNTTMEEALKGYAEAFIPYVGNGKNPGLFSFTEAAALYSNFFQGVIKEKINGVLLTAEDPIQAEKDVNAILSFGDKQYIQFMEKGGKPATFENGEPMGLWVSADPKTVLYAKDKVADFKKKKEEESTYTAEDLKQAMENTFGLSNLEKTGVSSAFNNMDALKIREWGLERVGTIYALNASKEKKRELAQETVDTVSKVTTYKDLMEYIVSSGNLAEARAVYNRLCMDLEKGPSSTDWMTYGIKIGDASVSLHTSLYDEDKVSELAVINNDKAYQMVTWVKDTLGKALENTTDINALRMKFNANLQTDVTRITGLLTAPDTSWINNDNTVNNKMVWSLSTASKMCMDNGKIDKAPEEVMQGIADGINLAGSPKNRAMRTRAMAKAFRLGGMSHALLSAYTDKANTSGLSADERMFVFSLLYGADKKSKEAYDTVMRDPVAVSKLYEALNDTSFMNDNSTKLARKNQEIVDLLDEKDVPVEYRKAVIQGLSVIYAMDEKGITPSDPGFGFSSRASREKDIIEQNFKKIPGVQGSVFVGHPAFLDKGSTIPMEQVSNAVQKANAAVKGADTGIYGNSKNKIGVKFDTSRGFFVFTKNGDTVYRYTNAGGKNPFGLHPQVMVAMQTNKILQPYTSLLYGFGELAQQNMPASFIERIQKRANITDGNYLDLKDTQFLVHSSLSMLTNQREIEKIIYNAENPKNKVLNSNTMLVNRNGAAYKTLNAMVNEMVVFDQASTTGLRVIRGGVPVGIMSTYGTREESNEGIEKAQKESIPSKLNNIFWNNPSPKIQLDSSGMDRYGEYDSNTDTRFKSQEGIDTEKISMYLLNGMSYCGKINCLVEEQTDIARQAALGDNAMLNILAFNNDNGYVVG